MHIHGHGTGHSFQDGFTTLELMVSLSIACILLVAGMPSFQTFSQKQLMKAALNHLQNDLMLGRSQAVHRNTRVVTCPGTQAEGCSGTSEWSNGWIVFADDNLDRQYQPTETLVRNGQGFKNLAIHSTSARTDVRFFPDGSAPGSNGSITFCGLGGPSLARKLVISNLGRIRRDTSPTTKVENCPR